MGAGEYSKDMDRLYAEHDKIMLIKTGQVLTVHEDLSNHLDPGIIVKEKVGRLVRRSEVRPAGHTRTRLELEKHIVEPDPPVPLPKNCLKIEVPKESPVAEAAPAPVEEVARPELEPVALPPHYVKGDKVVLIDTGEVLTVEEDLSDREELGLIVKEKPGYVIMSHDVRPAGNTRERLELE